MAPKPLELESRCLIGSAPQQRHYLKGLRLGRHQLQLRMELEQHGSTMQAKGRLEDEDF